MWKTHLTAVLFLIAALACGEDLTTLDGKEYKRVTVNRVEADGIVIAHSTGVAKIPFTELPKEVQQRFGYDAAKIEAESATARAAEAERIQEQRAAEQNIARIWRNPSMSLKRPSERSEYLP
jgi:hypothetical protein